MLRRLNGLLSKPMNVIRLAYTLTDSAQISSILSSEFNREQENQVLDLLNTVSAQKLRELKYFTTQKALNLVKYRDEYGEFASLSDLMAVPGFGVLGVKRIAKAILNNETSGRKQLSTDSSSYRPQRSSICHPRITPEHCEDLDSVVALDIQQDSIFWVHMDRSLNVENWQKTPVFSTPMTKYDHAEYHHHLHHALSSIPEADAYLLENKIYRYQHLKIVPVVVSLRLLEAITVTMLNQHHFTQFGQHCVYMIKSQAIGNYFNLIVGGERVSCQHITRDVINRSSTHAEGVTVADFLADYFFGLNHTDQENLTKALLLAVIFYRKVVLPASKASQSSG